MTFPVISLKPSYNSVIRGCPGLPETLPRIECELRIRSNGGKAFKIDKIEIALKCIESLNNLSHHTFSSKPKAEKTSILFKKVVRMTEKEMLGIDIPLTIGLPEDIKETNYNTTFGRTITLLECNVRYNSLDEPQTFSRVINVEKYNFLPNSKLFPPIRRQVYSPDKRLVVDYTIKNPCVSTDDVLHINFEMRPNSKAVTDGLTGSASLIFNKKSKMKLKHAAANLKEYLEVYDDGSGTTTSIGGSGNDTRENVLFEEVKPINEAITHNGIKWSMDIKVLTKNETFKEFEKSLQEPASLYRYAKKDLSSANQLTNSGVKTELLQSKVAHGREIPFQYHTSITTTRGNLYRIIHGISIKFKINNGKSFQINQPIDITPWTVSSLKNVEQLILQERETAKYAHLFYQNYGGLKRVPTSTTANYIKGHRIDYPPLPPVVYLHDHETLKKLDIIYNRSSFSRIPLLE